MTLLEISDCGDSAVRVSARTENREVAWETSHLLARWLLGAGIDGVEGVIPTYDAVLVEFDPDLTSARQIKAFIRLGERQLQHPETALSDPLHFEVPVLYGDEYGPDLERVAGHQGITSEEVIALHTAKTYKIRCLGSPAGSPMMDGPEFPYPVPRLKDPRLSVPAGAVSVAGRQAVIAPAQAPGGWCVIGQTPLAVLNLTREPLVPYSPGDTLSFYSITPQEFSELKDHYLEARS